MKRLLLLLVVVLTGCPIVPTLVPMNECVEVLPPPLPMLKAKALPGGREDTGEIIDVMVLYTPKARAAAGGESFIEKSIQTAIGFANSAYQNCGAQQRVRLVYSGELVFTETGNSSNDLSAFTWASTTTLLRNQYGADCCSLICENLGGVCGTGYRMNSMTAAFSTYAMNVVQRNCLGQFSLAHELGHNMGCSHDRANASAGLLPYSYGARTSDKTYRDIMSYSPGIRVNLFGGAGISVSGRELGDVLNDCRRTLDATSKTVANFRLSIEGLPAPAPTATPTPTPTAIPSPTPGTEPDNMVYAPIGPVTAGATIVARWSLPHGGNAVDIYLVKGGQAIKQLKGGTPNDGFQSVLIPAVTPGTDFQLMIKQYSDLKKYYSWTFEIR